MDYIDYMNKESSFLGYTKHFFRDKQYYITVFANFFVMGDVHNLTMKTPTQKYPKYQYTLTMDTKIGWQVKQLKNVAMLEGMQFEYRGKLKTMYSDHESLSRLRETLRNRVTFINIRSCYIPQTLIASGSSAKVYRSKCVLTGSLYAIKAIDKEYINDCNSESGISQFLGEIKMLIQLQEFQDSFLQLFEIYESDSTYYLILQLLRGRSLTEEISKKSLTSPQIKQIMKKLLINLSNLHSKDIIHRDLKPGNLMFARKRDYSSLTLIDFGLSTYEDAYPYVFPKCGTPGYLAPEIANYKDNDRYSTKVDMYSVGCIFFELLTGNNFFMGSDQKSIWKQNKQFDVNIQLPIDNVYITEQSLDLLNQFLHFNPKDRISSKQALQHQYFEINMEASTLKQSTLASPDFSSPDHIINNQIDMDKWSKKFQVPEQQQQPNGISLYQKATLSGVHRCLISRINN